MNWLHQPIEQFESARQPSGLGKLSLPLRGLLLFGMSWVTAAFVLVVTALPCFAQTPKVPVAKKETGKQDTSNLEKKQSSRAAIRDYQSAVALQNRQVFDLAADQWASLIKKYPEDPLVGKARHYRGICLFQLKQYAAAEAALREVAEKHPKIELLESTLVNTGLAQFNQGQNAGTDAEKKELAEALVTFAQQLKQFPNGEQAPLARFYQAESSYLLGQLKPAIASYQSFQKNHPQHELLPKALYGLGVALQEDDQPEEAGKTFAQFLNLQPKHILANEVILRLAETEVAQGKQAQAETRFAKLAALKEFELADYALLRQAECQYEQKKYAAAAKQYASLVARFPKSEHLTAARLAAGKSNYLSGDGPSAEKFLAEALNSNGANKPEVAHWLARSQLLAKKPAEAEATVAGVLDTANESPFLVDLLLDQADATFEQKAKRAEAIKLYNAMAKAHPQHRLAPQAAYMAAFAALGEKQYPQAIANAKTFLDSHETHELAADVRNILAESQLLEKDYAAAAKTFQTLYDKHSQQPEAPNWLVRRGLCLYLAKQYSAVVDSVGPKLTRITNADQSAEAHYLVGASLLELDRVRDAVTMLRASLKAQPRWRQADATRLALAKSLQSTGDTQGAIAALDDLLAKAPKSKLRDRAIYRLGQYHKVSGDKKTSETDFARLLKEFPKSSLAPFALSELGWMQLAKNENAAAIAMFSKLLSEHPSHQLAAKASYARATALHKTGKPQAALDDLATFQSTDHPATELADALYLQGLCQAALKQHEAAAKSYSNLLARHKHYSAADKALYELAWAQQELDQADHAIKTFARLAEDYPKSPLAAEAMFRVGESQYVAKQYDKAIVSYSAALERKQDAALREKTLHKLAWAAYLQNDFAASRAGFAQQLKEFPKGALAADAQSMEGECWFQEKQYEKALAEFEKAIAHKPSHLALRLTTLLHAAQSASQLKKWQRSLDLLEICSKEFPESDHRWEILYEQAWAKHHLGKSAEALDGFRKVADEVDSVLGARARFMSGEILFSQKKHNEAVVEFFKVAYGYGSSPGVESPPGFHPWQADAMFEAARCLEAIKKPSSAKKVYSELVERFPKNSKTPAARERLAQLKTD